MARAGRNTTQPAGRKPAAQPRAKAATKRAAGRPTQRQPTQQKRRKVNTAEVGDKNITYDAKAQLKELHTVLTQAAEDTVREHVTTHSAEAVKHGEAALEEIGGAREAGVKVADVAFERRHGEGAKEAQECRPLVKRIDQTQKALDDALDSALAGVDKHHAAWGRRFKAQMEKVVRAA